MPVMARLPKAPGIAGTPVDLGFPRKSTAQWPQKSRLVRERLGRESGRALGLAPEWRRYSLPAHRYPSQAAHPDGPRRCGREIDDAAIHKRPAVINGYGNAFAVVLVGNAHARAAGERFVRGGE